LFAAVDLTILRNKSGGQATVTATITENTLAALPGILDPAQDGYHGTNSQDTLGPLATTAPISVDGVGDRFRLGSMA
jgi:hypothetical protein